MSIVEEVEKKRFIFKVRVFSDLGLKYYVIL